VGVGVSRAVYGESLLAFPEQFRDFVSFEADPNISDGYGPRKNEKKENSGVLQTATSRVKDGNGNLVVSRRYTLWTDAKLALGIFVEFEGFIYRTMTDSDWPSEGGFYDYDLEKVVGSAPGKTPVPVDTWNNGEGHF
jgi:hypothetical protein